MNPIERLIEMLDSAERDACVHNFQLDSEVPLSFTVQQICTLNEVLHNLVGESYEAEFAYNENYRTLDELMPN